VKKVGCQDLVGVLADELAQGPLAAAGYRLQAMASEHLAHGEMGTAVAQLEQLGNDPSVAPTLVSPWPVSSEIVKLAAGRARVNGHLKVRGFGQLKVRTLRLLSPL
jgi:hypothetical protein